MAGTNTRVRTQYGKTHEGGQAAPETGAFSIEAKDQLLRSVATCLLGENTFYESGDEIKDRIRKLSSQVSLGELATIAYQTRTEMKLRHVPLFLLVQMYKRKSGALGADATAQVIHRPDEMAELVSLYFEENGRKAGTTGHTKLPTAMKTGLGNAFRKFNAYNLSKWNQTDKAVKLKDVLFLSHAKPKDAEQASLWKALIDGNLPVADTWETALSSGADKKETWERLLREAKIGYMALLMNLRNMEEAKVDHTLVENSIITRSRGSWALPFRFVTASKYAPSYGDALDKALLSSVEGLRGRLKGHTAVCVDISGSMSTTLSEKSKTSRAEAGASIAALAREICEQASVLVFGTDVRQVITLRGLGLVEAIRAANDVDLVGSGTNIAGAVQGALDLGANRIILITDEQGHTVPKSGSWKGYLMNVAPYGPGLVTNQDVVRINGFSERIFDYVSFEETGKVLSEDTEE